MDTTQNVENRKAVFVGAKMFLVDAGTSFLLGLALGLVMGFVQLPPSLFIKGAYVIGILTSAYAAYLAYERYSQSVTTLISMSAIVSAVAILSAILRQSEDLATDMLLTVGTVVAYIIGWYVAKQTGLKLWLPHRVFIAILMWIGVLAMAFTVLSLVSAQ